LLLIACALPASQLQAAPSSHRFGIYARPGDTFFDYGQPACGQKYNLKTAERYAGWCREYRASTFRIPCGLNNTCETLLSPVVRYCDEQRQGNIDYPGKGYSEPAECNEARRVFEPDAVDGQRREKIWSDYVAQHNSTKMSDAEWKKLHAKLDGK